MSAKIWTIGHSTRTLEELVELLMQHDIQQLADVRAFPASRRYPHFNRPSLEEALPGRGISYSHWRDLGGRRPPPADSSNTGWRNAGFRGYADYTQTEPFWSALAARKSAGSVQRTAMLCAKAVPWRCHRPLIVDAFTVGGWIVRHILMATNASVHELTSFARGPRAPAYLPPDEGGRRS